MNQRMKFGQWGRGVALAVAALICIQPIPSAVAVEDMLAVDTADGIVLRFSGTNGAFQSTFISGLTSPVGIALSPNQQILYVSQFDGKIFRYNSGSGAPLDAGAFLDIGATAQGLTVDTNGNLIIGTFGGRLLRYSAGGASVPGNGEIGSDFSDALGGRPRYSVFGFDGNVYASQTDLASGNKVYKINGANGDTLANFASISVGVDFPEALQLTFGPSFNAGGTPDLYVSVSDVASDYISVFEGSSGALLSNINLGFQWRPHGVGFNPNDPNKLIVVSGNGAGSRFFQINGNGSSSDLGAFLSGSPSSSLNSFVFIPEPSVGMLVLGGGLATLALRRRGKR